MHNEVGNPVSCGLVNGLCRHAWRSGSAQRLWQEEDKQADTDIARPVLYMVVEPKPVTQTGFAGTIEPRYSTDLAFRVLGRIINRPVQVGDLVKKDEMVAMVDPSNLDLAVQSARADLASAEAQFANASASEERQRILLRAIMSRKPITMRRDRRATAPGGLEKAQAGLKRRRTSAAMPCYARITTASFRQRMLKLVRWLRRGRP